MISLGESGGGRGGLYILYVVSEAESEGGLNIYLLVHCLDSDVRALRSVVDGVMGR